MAYIKIHSSSALGTVITWELLVSLAGAMLIGYIVYQKLLSPLANVPGPFLASLSNLWWTLKIVQQRDQAWEAVRLHEKYGPVVRIGPKEIALTRIVADPDAFKTIYGAGNGYHKSEFYRPMHGNSTWNITTEQNERLHSVQRRLVSKAYSLDSLKTLESFVDHTVDHFLTRLRGYAGQVINLGDWLQLFAIDTVGEVTFSKSFGYIDRGDDAGFLRLTKRFLASGAWLGFVPWVLTVHDILRPIFGTWLGIHVRDTSFHGLAAQQTKAHQAREDNHLDILGYLEIVGKQKPDQFSESDLINMLTSNVFAGSDTTSISLRAIIHFMLTSPDCLRKFQKELKDRTEAGLLSNPVRYEEAQAWPLLQAIMHESLRLHSPFAIHLPRVVPEKGLIVNGHYLPSGTHVGTNAWVIHRNKEIFGDDVNEFRPERWLDLERKTHMQRFFFAFGGGSRTCLGRNVVWLEMSKLLPALFREFDMTLTHPEKPLPVEFLVLAVQDGPEVVIRERLS